MKIKIAFFTTSLGGGGAEMQLLRLLNNIDHERFHCTLVVSRGGGSYEKLLREEVQVVHLPTGNASSNTWRLIKSVKPLRKYIIKERPDIVCGVMDRANVAVMAAIKKFRQKPYTVLCVQNNPVYQYKIKPSIMKRGIFYLMNTYYPKADKIIPLSKGVFEELDKMIPGIESKSTIIHNAGFDQDVYEKIDEKLDREKPKEPLLVACGRLVEQKGYTYMFKALKLVAEQQDFRFWILGVGPLEDKLKQLRDSLGLSGKIEFLGFQDNPFKYMAAADVFVLSSLWEGFGNVVAEAMICGTAVISTNCPYGPGEIIEDNKSGLLVPAADAEKLAEKIICLLENPDLRTQLAAEGASRAKKFSAKINAQKYERVFTQLING